MFTCPECKQKKKSQEKVFKSEYSWCRACVAVEDQRLYKEDYLGGYKCTRPPRYMFDPNDPMLKKFYP